MKKLFLIFLAVFLNTYVLYSQNWRVLDSLCFKYTQTKPDSAITLGKKAIEESRKEKGGNSIEHALCLSHLANAFKNKAKYTVADSLNLLATEICKSINKVESKEHAEIIDNLGLSFYEQGRYNEAEKLYITAKNIRENLLGKENTDYAGTCNNLALLYQAQGRYLESELMFIEGKNIYIKVVGKEHPLYAVSCNSLAVLYQSQGRFSEAEQLFVEAKNIRAKTVGKEHPAYANSCNNLAVLYKNQGKYPEAEALYLEAKNIRAKIYGKKHPDYATSCNNLAILYKNQGRYQEAEQLYLDTKNIDAVTVGKTHPYYASSCANLALLYQLQERYSEAETLYSEAMNIRYKLLGEYHPDYASSCNNLAVLYKAQNRYSEAEALFLKAKNIYSKVLGKEHPNFANSCNNIALLYMNQNRYSEAETLFIEAKNIRAKILGKEHPEYITSCSNIAVLYEKSGKNSQAETLFLEAIAFKQKEIERNFVNLSEVEKEQYVKVNVNTYFNFFQKFVSKYVFEKSDISIVGYELSIITKGLILNSSEKIKNRIMGSNSTELRKLYLEWKNTKDKYNKALNLTIEQRKKKKINLDSLQNTANEYEKQLSLKSEDFSNIYTPKRVTWKDIQNTLQKNEANVEIVKYEISKDSVGYMAYIIKKDSPYPEVVVFENGNGLEKSLDMYRRTIRSKLKDDFSYNTFWKPIADKLKGIKHIYFCPDGVYHQINLNTLQNPKTKKYIFDEIKITQVTNSKDIIQTKKHVQKGIYLFGNPKYELEKETPKGNQREVELIDFSSGVSQLQGAENEVKAIDSLIKKRGNSTSLYIQEQATEEQVKTIKNPRVLHIATHGYFKRGKYQTAEQAMRNAGLLMAGVVDIDRMEVRPYDKEDGKLTAFEIMNMELDSTELVVLSACETGLGEVSKEGVYGLQRAFKVAGANTIIMSLWKVDDFSTQKLMRNFYYYWQTKNMDKKSAFLKAQSELRKINPHPYYWGAFVMIE